MAKKVEGEPESNHKADTLAVEVGRIAKLFALYLLKDATDESKKVTSLRAVGFSISEIAALLDKSTANVNTQLSQARKRREKKTQK